MHGADEDDSSEGTRSETGNSNSSGSRDENIVEEFTFFRHMLEQADTDGALVSEAINLRNSVKEMEVRICEERNTRVGARSEATKRREYPSSRCEAHPTTSRAPS